MNTEKKSQKFINQDDSLDSHPMLLPSRKGSKLHPSEETIYDVIIIGAGISGLLAAQILLKQQKSVLVLQSQKSYGGSIKQQTIGEMILKQNQPEWIIKNELVNNAQIDIGTSQIQSDHSYMIKLIQQYDLTLNPLYSDGKFIYGESQFSIKTMMSLMDIYFCPEYKKIISKLLAKIQNISKNILEAHNKITNNPGKNHYRQVLKQYIEKFDNDTNYYNITEYNRYNQINVRLQFFDQSISIMLGSYGLLKDRNQSTDILQDLQGYVTKSCILSNFTIYYIDNLICDYMLFFCNFEFTNFLTYNYLWNNKFRVYGLYILCLTIEVKLA